MLVWNRGFLLCSDSLELLLLICLLIIVKNTGLLIWSPITEEDYSGLRGIAHSVVSKVEITVKGKLCHRTLYFGFFLHVLETFWGEKNWCILLGKWFWVTSHPVSNSVWPHKGQGELQPVGQTRTSGLWQMGSSQGREVLNLDLVCKTVLRCV